MVRPEPPPIPPMYPGSGSDPEPPLPQDAPHTYPATTLLPVAAEYPSELGGLPSTTDQCTPTDIVMGQTQSDNTQGTAHTTAGNHQATTANTCSVCHDDTHDTDYTTVCMHKFHTGCLDTWRRRQRRLALLSPSRAKFLTGNGHAPCADTSWKMKGRSHRPPTTLRLKMMRPSAASAQA